VREPPGRGVHRRWLRTRRRSRRKQPNTSSTLETASTLLPTDIHAPRRPCPERGGLVRSQRAGTTSGSDRAGQVMTCQSPDAEQPPWTGTSTRLPEGHRAGRCGKLKDNRADDRIGLGEGLHSCLGPENGPSPWSAITAVTGEESACSRMRSDINVGLSPRSGRLASARSS